MFQQSGIIGFLTSPPPAKGSLFHLAAMSQRPHVSDAIPHGAGDTRIVFLYRLQDDAESTLPALTVALQRLRNIILHACLSCTLLHAGISPGNTEVHPLPNKSQSTAFLLYTSRHLACNLPVCRGDLWPPNDPNRRHTCNCSGWRNDSLFQYLFIHTWGNEREFFLFFCRGFKRKFIFEAAYLELRLPWMASSAAYHPISTREFPIN